jgi:5'-nucleotidase
MSLKVRKSGVSFLLLTTIVSSIALPATSQPAQAMAKIRNRFGRHHRPQPQPQPVPSAQPSETPSPTPSVAPSTAPSPTPVPSLVPSPTPSVAPSAAPSPIPSVSPQPVTGTLAPNERLITILQTNDIHGGVEPSTNKKGEKVGGLAMLAGVVRSIREGTSARYGSQGGVLMVDGGDQFQGTLISNYNEGQLVFSAMNEVGYDAAITGNHDYDFGPVGWLEDQVTAQTQDQNPRGALLRVASQAKFPMISANTYLKSSFVDEAGKPMAVDGGGCKPSGKRVIDWSRARHPEYLKPYVLKTVAGDVRVALIGMDNPGTPETTTQANVSDLCFADEAESYLRAREELEGQADVFVMVIHDGNSLNEFGATKVLQKIVDKSQATGRRLIDAVAAGHTHFVNNVRVKGVPLIQSGSGGDMFGRIDLVYDTQARTVLLERTKVAAGVSLGYEKCSPGAAEFCKELDHGVSYDGVRVRPSAEIDVLVSKARAEVAPLASRKLGVADGPLQSNRISESSMADVLTDALRAVSGADVAFMNTGGLRAPIDAGDVTYEELFKVIPFNNRGVVIEPMGADKLLGLLGKSIQTCGSFGALMQSGLRVTFSRDCAHAGGGVDSNARLLHVETVAGEVILDAASGVTPAAGKAFRVATLDFLAAGGSGFDGFKGAPITRDLGIVREVLADQFEKALAEGHGTLSSKPDGRWAEAPAPASGPQTPANPR